jgi:hypothetical protein
MTSSHSLQPPSLQTYEIVLLLVDVLALTTILAFAAGLFYGLEANSKILRIRSWSGRYVEVPWHAIEAVDPIFLVGLPLLRVRYSGASKPASIPLWLSEPSAFRAAINAYAGGP